MAGNKGNKRGKPRATKGDSPSTKEKQKKAKPITPENVAEFCVECNKDRVERKSIHPTALCLLEIRENNIIFSPPHGNVSMMKPENAAEILDGLLGGHLDSKPHIITRQPLDANKLQIMTTYARVSQTCLTNYIIQCVSQNNIYL